MTYKYTVDTLTLQVFKYMDDDEECGYRCFEDFKEAKHCLLEELDKKVQWALKLTSRNYNK